MPTVPQYNRETRLNSAALPYQHYNITADTFGASVARAGSKLAEGLDRVALAAQHIQHTLEETEVMEFNNAIESWRQNTLLDKDNGYFTKKGADAAGKSPEIMKSYDDFVSDWQKNHKLSKMNTQRINSISAHKRSGIIQSVSAHDLKQTNDYAVTQGSLGIQGAISNGVTNRNNPEEISKQIANIKQICAWQGELQNLDKSAVDLLTKESVSSLYAAILDTKLHEGDLSAGSFFEEHKEDIKPELHAKYIGAIKNEEEKYKTRELADFLYANSPDETAAFSELDKRKDGLTVDEYDTVAQRLSAKYSRDKRLKDHQQADIIDNFYNTAMQKIQNGETISVDDIPDGLEGKNYISIRNSIDSLNKVGDIPTDTETETYLWYTADYNAETFKNMNLAMYRHSLSREDYEALKKRQEAIQKGDYYTILTQNDATKKYIKAVTGINNKDAVLFNNYQSMLRSWEQQTGRKATDLEKENILKYLGTNKDAYKLIEKGIAEQAGFSKKLANNIAYYQARHNGDMPPEDMVYKWLKNDTIQLYNSKYLKARDTAMARINAKPNEQKTLTYFADVEVPEMAKDLGLNLTITSRYRNQEGSKHKEGRALDLSMSEHSMDNRKKIYRQLLKNPKIQAIGCSDPVLLSEFRDEVKKGKIVDERSYDKQHGTNHENHAHITLYNDGTAKPDSTNLVVVRNRLKNGGYSDAQINEYLKSKGLI